MKKIFSTGLMLALLATASSCSDFLELEPRDNRVESNFYQTESDAMEALVAAYSPLQFNTVVGYHPIDMLSNILSDEAYAGGGSASDAPNIIEMDRFRMRTANAEVHGLWRKGYIGVYRTNMFLAKIGQMQASEAFKKRTVAEAKFLRAWYYFELVKLFGNVPLVLKPLDPAEYSQPQAPAAQVYAQIAKDLNEAIADLPASVPGPETGRVTKWAAKAFLGRVYLYHKGVMGQDLPGVNAAQATAHLEDVIKTGGFELLPNYGDNFKRASEFSKESVFEIAYSDNREWWDWGYIHGGQGNISVIMCGIRDYRGPEYVPGWSFCTPTLKLANAFEAGDLRKAETLIFAKDLKSDYAKGYQHTGVYTKKYTTSAEYKPGGGQTELNFGNNYRAIRFSDVLLMAAELHAAAGNVGAAQPYMDRVRQRAGLAAKPATLENIYKERQVELALEGHRYWDLLRRGLVTAKAEIDVKNYAFTPDHSGDAQDFNVEFNPATKGLFPIPQTEIDLSAGVFKQNAGY